VDVASRLKGFGLSGICSFFGRILGSIEPEWFKGVFQAIPEGIAQVTADRGKPVSLFGLLRRLTSKTASAACSAAVDFLQALDVISRR